MSSDFDLSLTPYVKAVSEKKIKGLAILDVRKLTSIADAFIICSGHSNRQVSSIAEHVKTELKKSKIRPLHIEGVREGQWVLMDYGHVIIHVFYEPVRSFYDLDGLWEDARKINTGLYTEA